MTFEEIFNAVKEKAKHAHAGAVSEWVAVEVNITGEGAGVFYFEVRNRILYIQPQEYPRSHIRITLDGRTLMAILAGRTDIKSQWLAGNVKINGDLSKLKYLNRIEI